MKISLSVKQKNIFWYILFGAILLFSLISAAGLEFQEDFMALVPKEKNRSGNYKELLKYFNPLDKCYFIQEFSGEGEFDEAVLIESGDALFHELDESGLFSRILYQWDYSSLQATLDLLQKYRFSLLNSGDLEVLESRIQYPEMLASFQEWKRQLYTSSDPMTARQFLADPIQINELLMQKWTGMGGEGGVTVHEGRFFSSDHTRILMIADPHISGSDSSLSGEFLSGVDGAIARIEKRYPGLKISYLSGHRYTEENASRIKRDVQLTVTLSLLVIILLSLAVYSRKFLPLMTLLPAFFGGAVALGVCRWVFPELSAIIIGCGAMLIGIAVDYGIHFLFHADSVVDN